MQLLAELQLLFSEFNKNGIKWCILRDGGSIESINGADDLDLSVSSADFSRAAEILQNCGWQTPKLNPNTFGHVQYYRWAGGRIYKIDILRDVYFADGLYEMASTREIYEAGQLPQDNLALRLLVLHVILDKQSVSDKNFAEIRRLYEKVSADCGSEVREGRLSPAGEKEVDPGSHVKEDRPGIAEKQDFILNLAEEILFHDRELHHLQEYRRALLDGGYVKKRDNRLWKLRRKLRVKLWRHRTKQTAVALIGVDGTGKSTLLDSLKEYYGDRAFVQYMGFRSYVSENAGKWADRSAPRSRIPGVNLFRSWGAFYKDMKIRYDAAVKSGRPLVLFDRYPWEAFDNAKNAPVKAVTWVCFRLLFPRPDHVIYLTCPAEESLARKSDISDQAKFVQMKNRFDRKYGNRKNTLVLDTSQLPREEVTARAAERICMVSEGKMR